MSEHALKTRGIEDEDTGTLLVAIRPHAGYADLIVRNGTQPLGREASLYFLKLFVEALLRVWPDAGDQVTATVERARVHARAPEKDAA
ncbi:hypothetical protein [Methylobacterium gnaphalii]|uniref:Uncharacterized protein n=1 Tax=Methylobacterium gnaphalii TaxID=1010610 RepID=A0A512JIT2_9HYPH|nr:hypothetical protein [Methylobacterium gnaphalii]GEP09861.1 hypothetical protein MGN01_17060 [Methylobacterium gnaphalii]GJD67224.1 hypothetical protein MMMDOFMJ_0138 [Methylobacterium gnaphalii]GLS49890.1 hypothetical protein GCM10007885_27420 [Methylobacterium gnaphalii]